mmetsp:Transcript_37627/g.40852  ORF Transcript_37627/g.40852 Transcript_37627/m.40852 type:complete len:322 (-) Transcript_37627:354-1319(-)
MTENKSDTKAAPSASASEKTTMTITTTTGTVESTTTGTVEGIYISPKSVVPMESRQVVTLIPGVGIDGDRYALQTGTYSAKFLPEPGRQLTIVSADAIEEAFNRTGMIPLESLGDLRRNLVIRGISEKEMNDMVGHTIQVGSSLLFVHRRTVPCKYREAQCKRPGFMNNTWGSCGINCEILPTITTIISNQTTTTNDNENKVCIGDTLRIIPNSYQPDRIDAGRKPPSFFIRPADRSIKDIKQSIVPVKVAILFCLIDPIGFQRLEDSYNLVGQNFWSPECYQIGLLIKSIRIPFLTTLGVAILSIVIGLILHLQGINVGP